MHARSLIKGRKGALTDFDDILTLHDAAFNVVAGKQLINDRFG